MPLTPLAPAAPARATRPRWSFAASSALHLAVLAIALAITARRAPPAEPGSPSFDLVFEGPPAPAESTKPPGLPPIQPADIPIPPDAPLGAPAPAAMSPPQPDGQASPVPEAAATTAPSPAPAQTTPPEPATAQAPPTQSAPAARLAFAPPTEPAITADPAPAETRPTAPPTVNLQLPSNTAEESRPPVDFTPIMPQPPPPLPPAPPSARPPQPRTPQRQALGTLSNPMDLSFAPAPRPAARGSVASRAIDLSPPPERPGGARSDPYAQIRAANASEDWNRGLLQYWLRHRFYPSQAAENGDQGTVTIQLTVDRSGRVDNVEVVSRSGSQWLDMAAVATFRNAKLPPFTNEMRQDRLTFPIPITYYLVRR